MANKLYNLARMTSATTGTGTLTLGSAASGYLSFPAAGVADGDVLYYGIADGANCECGYGTYTASGTTLSRNVIKSSNSNAAINCSGSQQVYITGIAADGGDMLPGTVNPLRGFDAPINLQLNASVGSSKLTVAVKGNNGSDPSQTNPVLIPFRDATAGNGDPVWIAITSALSIDTNAVGASLGTVANQGFRVWVVAFNNGGSAVLGLIQTVGWIGTIFASLAPIEEGQLVSTTAMSGSATGAGVLYTPNGTTLTSKAFRILGYVEFGSGQATPGTYLNSPTKVQLFGPGVRKPGDVVQIGRMSTSSVASSTSSSYTASNITLSITPTSAANLIEHAWWATPFNRGSVNSISLFLAMHRGSTQVGSIQEIWGQTQSGNAFGGADDIDAPNTTSSTTYTLKFKNNDATTNMSVPADANDTAVMTLKEIMT